MLFLISLLLSLMCLTLWAFYRVFGSIFFKILAIVVAFVVGGIVLIFALFGVIIA